MTTNNFSPATVGWVAIATGASSILAVLCLALMFTVNRSFGTANDVLNGIVGISSVILAWMLYAEHRARSPLLSQVALVLALLGAIFVVIGSILVIFKVTGFVLAGFYTSVGNALIGCWLVAFCYSMQRGDGFPNNLITLGLVVGVLMAMGFLVIPGIVAEIDSMESLPWYLTLGYVGFLATYLLYPVWTIGLGRNLLLK